MSKTKPLPKTGRLPMDQVLRLARGGTHVDRKKKANKDACRGKVRVDG